MKKFISSVMALVMTATIFFGSVNVYADTFTFDSKTAGLSGSIAVSKVSGDFTITGVKGGSAISASASGINTNGAGTTTSRSFLFTTTGAGTVTVSAKAKSNKTGNIVLGNTKGAVESKAISTSASTFTFNMPYGDLYGIYGESDGIIVTNITVDFVPGSGEKPQVEVIDPVVGKLIKEWNPSYMMPGEFSEENGLKAIQPTAVDAKTIQVDTSGVTIDTHQFTQRIKTQGSGGVGNRCLTFTTEQACKMLIYGKNGSSSASSATIDIHDGVSVVGQLKLGSSSDDAVRGVFDLNANTTYYLYGPAGSVSFYYIALGEGKADTNTAPMTNGAIWNVNEMPVGVVSEYNGLVAMQKAGVTAGKEVLVEALEAPANFSDAELGNFTFTQRLKTQGAGNPVERALKFSTNGSGKVIIIAKNGSGNSLTGPMQLHDGADVIATFNLGPSSQAIQKVELPIPAEGTYYLYGVDGTININYIQTVGDGTIVTQTTTETTTVIVDEPTTEVTTAVVDEPTTEVTTAVVDEPTTEVTTAVVDEPTTENTTTAPVDGILGDANEDGSLTASDAAKVLQYVLNTDGFEISNLKLIDVSGDGTITASDAAKILAKVLNNDFVY